MVQKQKITTGTAEWCDETLNIFKGCKENCIYCYSKRIANHFGWKKAKDWKNMEFNEKAFNGPIPKIKDGKLIQWFMFPSAHNITPGNVDICLQYILRVLNESAANILIVIKPYLRVVMQLCEELYPYKERILFRFTITSYHQKTLKKYEPNAPDFPERFTALRYTHYHRYKTSVSIEPFLDMNPIPLIRILEPYCTETIWLGKLNYMHTDFNTWSNVQKVVENVKQLPKEIRDKIRLKDSIVNMYKKRGLKINAQI